MAEGLLRSIIELFPQRDSMAFGRWRFGEA